MMDEEFVRNQFFAHQPHDAELLLCLAETLHTGMLLFDFFVMLRRAFCFWPPRQGKFP